MKWPDLEKSGFSLSVQQDNNKKKFFLKIVDLKKADKHIEKLKTSGFQPVSGTILSAPLSYPAKNAILSLNGATLFNTTSESQHDNPFDGFRPVRSTGSKTHGEPSSTDASSQEIGGNPGILPPVIGSGDSPADRGVLPTDSEGQPGTYTGHISEDSPSEQLGDEHSDSHSSTGTDSSGARGGSETSGGNEQTGSTDDVEHSDGQSDTSRGSGSGEERAGTESNELGTGGTLEREPPSVEVVNQNPDHYYITNEIDREGGFEARVRVGENMEAISLLRKLENDDRSATEEEKSELVKYNGWGGIKANQRQYAESKSGEYLSNLISSEEKETLDASVLNAHFTPPHIVKAMWESIKSDLGFKGGNILEPSMGVGNFLGLAPKSIAENSTITGIELDQLSGKIAHKIYPDAQIHVQGFEDTPLVNDKFDLAITNVPFGSYAIHDKAYDKDHSIHNYCIIKALDKLKPGGIGAFITSSYTMDGLNRFAKKEMHNRAHLLGALRLPNTAVEAQAGAVVSTDILLFQKRVSPKSITEPDPQWLEVFESTIKRRYNDHALRTSSHFIENPESLVGHMDIASGQFGPTRVVTEDPARPFEQLLPQLLHETLTSEKVKTLLAENERILQERKNQRPPKEIERVELADLKKSIDSFVKKDGKVYQITTDDGKGEVVKGNAKKIQRLSGLIDLRERLNEVYDIQRKTEGDDEQYIALRNQLRQEYDQFVAKNGYVNSTLNRRLFLSDPEAGKVMSLEFFDEKSGKGQKADVFFRRIIGPPKKIDQVDTAHEALTVCMDRHNRVDLQVVGALCEKTEPEVRKELKDSIFLDPKSNKWEIAALYLSGNVRTKLEEAEEATKTQNVFSINVKALKNVVPEPIPASDIETRIGVPWISVETHQDFVKDLLGVQHMGDSVILDKRLVDAKWTVDINTSWVDRDKMIMEFGTQRAPFGQILKNCLAQKIVTIHDTVELPGGEKKRVYNHEETVAAQHKQEQLQNHFREFIWAKDPERSKEIAAEYNRRHNSFVPPKFDGSHMTFPGMSELVRPRYYQSNAICRTLYKNTLLNHEVGIGKTFEQVTAAMEMRRLGVARKPVMVIPNHTLEQINREALKIYPDARILLAQQKDFQKSRRKQFIGKVANNDWDLVIMGHTMFERINVDSQFEKSYLQDIKSEYKSELQRIQALTDGKTKTQKSRYGEKDIQKRIKTLETKIKRLGDSNKDDQLYFHELGVDALFIDEAHRYKNLMIVSASAEVSGNIKGSKRAWDLFMKIQYLKEEVREDNKGVVFATGTPVTNNPLEIYNMQRYLQMDTLEDQKVSNATDWYSTFIYPKVSWEPSHAARGWNIRVRPCLHNVPELLSTLREVMDVMTADEAGIKRPEVTTEIVVSPMSELQEAMMDELDDMVQANEEHVFTIMHRGRTMALDPRILLEFDDQLPEDWTDPKQIEEQFPLSGSDYLDAPNSKLSLAANNIAEIWEESAEIRGTQLVFGDLGVPGTGRRFNIYDALKDKLVDKGILAEEIQFIHDFPKDDQKARLFEDVRQGNVRVLVGSTAKMGEGLNVQDRAVALHNLDAPYTPAGIEQRNGRINRFGNLNDNVKILNYTTKDTFDLFLWNLLKLKNAQFKQILSGISKIRKFDFEVEASYAETAALTSGNPLIREKLDVEEKITRLEALESHFQKTVDLARLEVTYEKRVREGNKKTFQKVCVLPDIQEDPPMWRIKASKYEGFVNDLETEDRERFTKAVRALKVKIHLTRFKDDTLSFAGIPIHTFTEQDEWDSKKTNTVWGVGGLTRPTASRIEELLVHKERIIERFDQKLSDQAQKIDRLQVQIDKSFEQQDQLVELKVLFNDIIRRIEADAIKPADDALQSIPEKQEETIADKVGKECIQAIDDRDKKVFFAAIEELGIDALLPNQRTPLLTALRGRNEEFSSLILEKGADANATGEDNYPPLHLATQFNLAKACDLLITSDAKMNGLDAEGNTALHVSAFNDSIDAAKVLLDTGQVDTSIQNNDKETALFEALQFHRQEIGSMIVQHSSILDLEKQNMNGETVAHLAVNQDQLQVFQDIYDKHPDLMDVPNTKGESALDLIENENKTSFKNFLDGQDFRMAM